MGTKKRSELVETISKLVSLLSEEEKQKVFGKQEGQIPVSIFTSSLSGLESLVLYLKEHQRKAIKEIASLLNRKLTTIYTTYKNARKKNVKLDISDTLFVTISIFSDRKYSVLESLVSNLKETHRLTLKEISILLNRSYSTIKTVYWRYKKK